MLTGYPLNHLPRGPAVWRAVSHWIVASVEKGRIETEHETSTQGPHDTANVEVLSILRERMAP